MIAEQEIVDTRIRNKELATQIAEMQMDRERIVAALPRAIGCLTPDKCQTGQPYLWTECCKTRAALVRLGLMTVDTPPQQDNDGA